MTFSENVPAGTEYADGIQMRIIARIRTDFPSKFGIPRQSGLAETEACVVFEKEYRRSEAFKGISEYSHLWLIWYFSETADRGWSPTVRPPRLGGNRRMGVFATRSPFRPNAIGLSSVRLLNVEMSPELGPVLHVTGADMADGTPIFDVKPYLAFTDSHENAVGGFADGVKNRALTVSFLSGIEERVPEEKRAELCAILSGDPRPSYQNDPSRVYGFGFAGMEIAFTVDGDRLTVCNVAECR